MADKKISALPAATTPLAGTEVLPIVQSGTTDQVSVANLTAGRAVSALSYVTTGGSGNGQITITKNSTVATENTAGLAIQAAAANAYTELLLGTDDAIDSGYIQTAGKNTSYTSKTLVLQPNGGDVKQGAGNVIFGTAAKGINFTANTPAAGKTSQLLNWYEEGTWTPTQGNFGTWTSPVFNATYTRVGRSVTINVRQNSGTIASGAAGKYISGLPFAPATAGASGVAVNGSLQSVSDLVLYSDGNIYFVSDTGSQSSLQFSITYMV